MILNDSVILIVGSGITGPNLLIPYKIMVPRAVGQVTHTASHPCPGPPQSLRTGFSHFFAAVEMLPVTTGGFGVLSLSLEGPEFWPPTRLFLKDHQLAIRMGMSGLEVFL